MLRPLLLAALELLVVAVIAAVVLASRGGSASTIFGRLQLTQEGPQVTALATLQNRASAVRETSLDWGDGGSELVAASEQGNSWAVRAEHTYQSPGSYAVQLVASFEDGSTVVRSRTVIVAPTPSFAGSPPSRTPSRRPAASAQPAETPTATPEATATPAATLQPTATGEPTTAPQPSPTAVPEPTARPEPAATPEPQPTAATNQPPEIGIVSLAISDDPLTIALVANMSDPEGQLIIGAVSWGDGTSTAVVAASTLVESHTYAEPGTYLVTVLAFDARGAEESASQSVTVGE